jgi:hypothetical protein
MTAANVWEEALIRPILATHNPYNAARDFEKAGWTIDFQTPPDSGDPLCGVSLYGNELLLGTMEEKFVSKEALPFVGAGVELHVTVPASGIRAIHQKHAWLNPTELQQQPWGETAFKVEIQGYVFMIVAEDR